MGPLGLCQGFKPVGYFVEPFVAGLTSHTRIHIRVFVSFAGDGCFKIIRSRANGLARRGVASFFRYSR